MRGACQSISIVPVIGALVWSSVATVLHAALLVDVEASQKPEPTDIERTHRSGKHNATVRLEIGPFDATRHKIRLFRPPGSVGHGCTEVDGNPNPLGTDCDAPKTEIRRVTAVLDGVALTIPASLYRDCFNPTPGSMLAIRLSDDGKSAFVFFGGSDAAASYQVIWVLRADGRHSRLSCPPAECSDVGLINFDALSGAVEQQEPAK